MYCDILRHTLGYVIMFKMCGTVIKQVIF